MNTKFKILEKDKNQPIDDFYRKFKEKLELTHTFPSDYLFKYIVPSEPGIIARLHSIFETPEASISTRDSKNGKYTCMTIKVPVNDADDVVIYYRQTSAIEGIMML